MISSPFIVMMRALVSATSPRGCGVSKSKPMTVFRGAGGFSFAASGFKILSKLCSWKFSPSVHCTALPPGDHASQSPDAFETVLTGNAVSVELSLTVLPTFANGAT